MPDAPVLLAGRYLLGEVLGRGGMGEVHLARDETLERDVAIKELDQPLGDDPDAAARRTLREARAAARLNHPNVIQVYDVLQLDGRTWIVMEYVPSRSLRQVIVEDGPLDPYQVAQIGLDLVAALRAAHRAGVQHRDVKPANVLLATDGRVLLGDFGIAAMDDDAVISRTDVVVGSPHFMAPERASTGKGGPAADLWSLGATLYNAVEGRSPYQRGSTMATLTALATEEPDPPRQAGVLTPVLDRLLRKNPAVRMGLDETEQMLQSIVTGTVGSAKAPKQKRRGLFSRVLAAAGASRASDEVYSPADAPAASDLAADAPTASGLAADAPAANGTAAGAPAADAPAVSGLATADRSERDGSLHDGSAHDGSVHDGSERDTSARDGSARGVAASEDAVADVAAGAGGAPGTAAGLDGRAVGPVGATAGSTSTAADSAGAPSRLGSATAEPEGKPRIPKQRAGEGTSGSASTTRVDADTDLEELSDAASSSPVSEQVGSDAGESGAKAADGDEPEAVASAAEAAADRSAAGKAAAGKAPAGESAAEQAAAERAATGNTVAGQAVGDAVAEQAAAGKKAARAEAAPEAASKTEAGSGKNGQRTAGAGTPGTAVGAAGAATWNSTVSDRALGKARIGQGQMDATPATGETRVAAAAGAGTLAGTAVAEPSERNGRRRLVVGAAAVAALVAVGVVTYVVGPGNNSTDRDGAQPSGPGAAVTESAQQPSAEASPAGAAPTDGVPSGEASASAPVESASPSVAASVSPDAGGIPALRDGWVDYKDATGFRVYVPEGWKRSQEGTIVYFRGDGRVLGIDQTNQPKSNPVKDWQSQSEYRVSRGDFPSYKEIKIESVDYFKKAADWEFTFTRSGTRQHVNNRGVVVSSKKAYGFYWQTTDSEWDGARDDLQFVFDSFRPVTK
ncbi:serine/threonine-protein kinase [Actinoplanes sp. NBRC 101535]|uniref:serine/threonine-protein kinase n=1 Tax=Actinoplanes sp. NBRC 101535 TaxID=3032196 RepID=UPI0024A0FCC4|nr:serine/threonine-protein kinase [Actinoplanes sp. NBRC 101535]GLY04254.1 hypothetical protein Acsp01_46330 [Actinoplanes sp. NBRC 101535]